MFRRFLIVVLALLSGSSLVGGLIGYLTVLAVSYPMEMPQVAGEQRYSIVSDRGQVFFWRWTVVRYPPPKNRLHWYFPGVYRADNGLTLEPDENGLSISMLGEKLGFSFLIPTVVFGIYPAIAGYRQIRHRYRVRTGRCLQCGYNLIGNASGVCPECGLNAT